MDVKSLRRRLERMQSEAIAGKAYHVLGSSLVAGSDPDDRMDMRFFILDDDFVLDDQKMFTFDEAIQIQAIGHDYGLRLPRAHEWRAIGSFVTFGGEYHGETKLHFVTAGHTWEGTSFSQTQDGSAYYWSGSSGPDKEKARAVVFHPSGEFNVRYRPRDEGMRVRLLLNPDFLK
ncbi:hypothetical protein IKG31_01745 [Candidatus Saccharibacteria bacterium]|nr:hypothetical protein [Candidatus Saccharibacteria bacterium]